MVGQSYDEYLNSHPNEKIDWQAAAKDFRQMMEVPNPQTSFIFGVTPPPISMIDFIQIPINPQPLERGGLNPKP